MKRLLIIVLIAIGCAGITWSAYQAAAPETQAQPLSKLVPAGPMLYIEAKDFGSLLSTWNGSAEKKQWLSSTSYEVFSRSRLFLRLKGAGDQFAAAAGLPPDMDFLTQVAGDHSALALYDIGKLHFLYITHLPSAKSMQTKLWQMRSKFEPRSLGNVNFYVRRDPESQREVAFAVAGDYLLLATREDLMAGALQLMSGSRDHSVEGEEWYSRATAASGERGDLRMVLNLTKVVPDGYFRTYWVQQNITDLSQYSAAISDLYLGEKQYREERTLIRKAEPQTPTPSEDLGAAGDVVRLVPDAAGFYEAVANPSAADCLDLLKSKLLQPRVGSAPESQTAPQVELTSGEAGSAADLETRIDQVAMVQKTAAEKTALEALIENTRLRAALEVQSTSRDNAGVFVRTHSAVVLVADTDWNQPAVQRAVTEFVRPSLTASQLGMGWQSKSGYQELDGLWPLVIAVRGNYLLLANDGEMASAMLAKFGEKSGRGPGEFFAGFDHARERENFVRLADVVDRPEAIASTDAGREPQFFSGTVASLSGSLASFARESIAIRGDKDKVHQTVTYEWSR